MNEGHLFAAWFVTNVGIILPRLEVRKILYLTCLMSSARRCFGRSLYGTVVFPLK